MNNINRIAIVGAGVAGLALAILATKRGYKVTVYERASSVCSIGAGVTLWPNAMFVLQQLGLAACYYYRSSHYLFWTLFL